jgi:hypothetical protein
MAMSAAVVAANAKVPTFPKAFPDVGEQAKYRKDNS